MTTPTSSRTARSIYTTIGKFCSIARMVRINPGNHPMQRASQAHFTYRASAYFEGEQTTPDFFAWRRIAPWHRPRCLDRPWRHHPARPHHRYRRGDRRGRRRHQGCRRPTRSSPACQQADQAPLPGRRSKATHGARLVGLGPRTAAPRPARFPLRCRSASSSPDTAPAERQPSTRAAFSTRLNRCHRPETWLW